MNAPLSAFRWISSSFERVNGQNEDETKQYETSLMELRYVYLHILLFFVLASTTFPYIIQIH